MNTVPAEPYAFEFDPATTALVIIDMQRDFVEPGGFGETLGNDVSHLQAVVPPLQKVLAAVREAGMTVIHTREGHVPDLSDCTGATDPSNHDAALHMVTMQGGVFGAVATSTAVIEGTTHAG